MITFAGRTLALGWLSVSLASRRLHPDAGGDPADFRRLTEARDLLLAQVAAS